MHIHSFHETKLHGTPEFPYIVYHGKMPDFLKSFPLHWHDEFEIIYITSGQIKVTIWSDTFTANEGDIILVMPHTLHSLEQISPDSTEYFNILFHGSILRSSETDTCYEKYITPLLSHEKTISYYEKQGSKLNSLLTPLLLSLIENRRLSYSTHEYLVKGNLYMVMHYLNQHAYAVNEKEQFHQLNYNKLKTAFYHIQNSYSKNITIKEVASLCGFSESHFMKLFKELTGTSFTTYLINYRLEIAARQLAETNASIIEISTNCGFNNHSYFTRTFVKKYGTTPSNYRCNAQKF